MCLTNAMLCGPHHWSGMSPRPQSAGPAPEPPLHSSIQVSQLRRLLRQSTDMKLPSGESRMVLTSCRATVGTIGNTEHNLEKSGKAGRSRWLGRRPRVRGVVMNPVDHPMGGGEGKSSGGHPRSRTGVLAKGFKTRSKKKASNKYIVERRKK